jgi:molybdopterin converting factor small subunit
MKVRVLLFAAPKQLVGTSQVEVELSEKTPTVGAVRTALQRDFPALGGMLAVSAFAVDSQWSPEDTIINSDSQVALIPPVSGG